MLSREQRPDRHSVGGADVARVARRRAARAWPRKRRGLSSATAARSASSIAPDRGRARRSSSISSALHHRTERHRGALGACARRRSCRHGFADRFATIVLESDAHASRVCRSLGDGVLSALPALTTRAGDSRERAADRDDRVRSGADARVSHPVPAVRGGARAGAGLERHLSRRLHDRRARRDARRRELERGGPLEGAFRRSRASRTQAARPAISTSPRSTAACSRRGIRRSSSSGRCRIESCATCCCRLRPTPTADGTPPHLVSRPRRRAARFGLRARPRARAGERRRRDRAHAHVDEAQDHRQLLHAAGADRIPGQAHAGAARRGQDRRRDPRAAHRRSGDGQRRVPRRRLRVPRGRVRAGADSRRPVAGGRCQRRGSRDRCGARSPSDASTASISIRRRCSSRGCRCG